MPLSPSLLLSELEEEQPRSVLVIRPPAPNTSDAPDTPERKLRHLLCTIYAGALGYYDDGEASDSREHPAIDFLRDSPDDIQRKIWERNRRAAMKDAA